MQTLRCAPASKMYSQLFGSVRTTILHPQWCFMVNDQTLVEWYWPVCFFSALNRTPLPIRSPHPWHQTLYGISNLHQRMTPPSTQHMILPITDTKSRANFLVRTSHPGLHTDSECQHTPDDQDTLIQFSCSFSQRMRSMMLHHGWMISMTTVSIIYRNTLRDTLQARGVPSSHCSSDRGYWWKPHLIERFLPRIPVRRVVKVIGSCCLRMVFKVVNSV